MELMGNTEEILHDQTPTPPHPLLLTTDSGINNQKQYLYSISENRFHRVSIPEFHDMEVVASAYGWIVLIDHENDNCYIWNPSSMEKIEIELPMVSTMYNCVMSKSPSEPGYCHIMFYSSYGCIPIQCLLLDGETVAPPLSGNGDTRVVTAAAFRGKIYSIVEQGLCFCFVIVEFDGTTLTYTPILKRDGDGSEEGPWNMPDMKPDWAAYMNVHMMKSPCGQELLLLQKVFMSRFLSNKIGFRVFRVDVDRRECVELDNIGERTIFLSDEGDCFCCSSSSSERGMYRSNCIYYTMPNSRKRCVYVYDLGDCSTTPLLPCPAARRSRRSKSNWIENVFSTQR